ncbi:hypothetical protein EON64_17240, partial [archaeon]
MLLALTVPLIIVVIVVLFKQAWWAGEVFLKGVVQVLMMMLVLPGLVQTEQLVAASVLHTCLY